jgi:hypothetical protein
MSNKKGDDTMISAATEDNITDRSQVLSLQAVKVYAEVSVKAGRAEYNAGSILVRSRHPIDELLRRGMIEGHHLDSGKRIMTIRDCAFGRVSGRIYNDLGEGDSGIDAMTLYTVTYRLMKRTGPVRSVTPPWQWIEIVCFCEPDMDGAYFSEADYRALYPFAPNIQNAFDVLDTALSDAREEIASRISKDQTAGPT